MNLKKQNEIFQTLLDNLTMGVFMVEAPSGKPILTNDSAYELLGRGIMPDTNKKNLSEVYKAFKENSNIQYPPDEMPVIKGMYGEKSYIDDMIIEKDSGERKNLEVYGIPVYNQKGKVWASIASFADITDRKKAELDLKESEKKYRLLVENSSDWIWEIDIDGNFLYASPQVKNLLGFEPEEVIGKNAFDLMSENEAKGVEKVYSKFVENKSAFSGMVNVNLHKNGSEVILESSGQPFFDVDGNFIGYRGIDRDITERKKAEEALKENEEKIRRIIEKMPVSIAITKGEEQEIEYINSKFTDTFGYDIDDIKHINQWWEKAYPDRDYRKKVSEEWTAKIKKAIEHKNEIEPQSAYITCKNGEVKFIKGYAYSIGENTIVSLVDLTELKELSVELEVSNAAKDKFFNIISHDLKNPFNSILGFSELLLRNFNKYEEEKRKKFIENIFQSSSSAYKLLENLLDWSRTQTGKILFIPEF